MSGPTTKSPFAGMDPYLEEFWHDIHVNLVGLARSALNDLLPEDLVARSEDRVAIGGGETGGDQVYQPDVTLTAPAYSASQLGEGVRLSAPIELVIEQDTDI